MSNYIFPDAYVKPKDDELISIRSILNNLELFLKLPDNLLDLEVTGNYTSYTTEKDDDGVHTYYVLSDDLHEIMLCETNDDAMLTYAESPVKGAAALVVSYNCFGGISSEY